MKIIEPSYEILHLNDPAEALGLIEQAGRVCYKSENKITPESAGPFVGRIRGWGHESVLEHSSMTVKFIIDRGVSHELVRHRLAAYCLSGDTSILRYSGGRKSLTIKDIYERHLDSQLNGRNKLMLLRSMNENGILAPNKFKKVVYSGKKKLYKVTTSLGYEIKTTLEHVFFTPNGEFKLKNIAVGEKVLVNGIPLAKDPDWLKERYHNNNEPISNIARVAGCSYATIRKYLTVYNLTKKLGSKPSGFAPWNKNITEFDDERVKRQAIALRNNHHNNGHDKNNSRWLGDGISSFSGKRLRFSKYKKDKCEWCGNLDSLENHHKDHDPNNFSEANKVTLCIDCHKLYHRGGMVKHIVSDTVTSIEYIGIEDAYDIEMYGPYHNFVANGFVVHNSQESTRYANYSKGKFGGEITVIRPCFWEEGSAEFETWRQAMEQAEQGYLELLGLGAKPQEARSVLPNSLKTEVVMTANFREWAHVFNLRCSGAAHPQIRQVMVPLRKEMGEKLPEIFGLRIEELENLGI